MEKTEFTNSLNLLADLIKENNTLQKSKVTDNIEQINDFMEKLQNQFDTLSDNLEELKSTIGNLDNPQVKSELDTEIESSTENFNHTQKLFDDAKKICNIIAADIINDIKVIGSITLNATAKLTQVKDL